MMETITALALAGILTAAIAGTITMLNRHFQRNQIASTLATMKGRALTSVQSIFIWGTMRDHPGNSSNAAIGDGLPNMHLFQGPPFRRIGLLMGPASVDEYDLATGTTVVDNYLLLSEAAAGTPEPVLPINVFCDTTVVANCRDLQVATQGFTTQGTACNTFNGTPAQRDQCPFQMKMYWAPACPGAVSCTNPGARIFTRLQYVPGPAMQQNGFVFNMRNYELDGVQVSWGSVDYAAACANLGGTWAQGTQSCNFNRGSCKEGLKMIGILPTGDPHCVSTIDIPGTPGIVNNAPAETRDIAPAGYNVENQTPCGPGEVATGLSGNGRVICENTLRMRAPAGEYTNDRDCPDGEKVVKVNDDGSVVCSRVMVGVTGACGNGQKLLGYNADNSPICSSLGVGAGCTDGYRVNGYDVNGAPTCVKVMKGVNDNCSAGQKLLGYTADGDKLCSSKGNGAGCGAGKWFSGYDGNGDPICDDVGHLCNAGQKFAGYDGTTPRCLAVLDSDQHCTDGKIQDGNNADGSPKCIDKPVNYECTSHMVEVDIPPCFWPLGCGNTSWQSFRCAGAKIIDQGVGWWENSNGCEQNYQTNEISMRCWIGPNSDGYHRQIGFSCCEHK